MTVEPTLEYMLTKALQALAGRGMAIEARHAYYEGNHRSQLGSKAWNESYRATLQGLVENRCSQIVDATAEAIVPQGFQAKKKDKLDEALAMWATERLQDEAETIVETLRTAEWAGVQVTVVVDYDSEGEVAFYRFDPRSCYVELDRAGAYLWAVHFWVDEASGYTHATVYTREQTLHLGSHVKGVTAKAVDFTILEEFPNVFGELMLGVVDKKRSVIDDLAPLNDKLNKSLQTEEVATESWVMPLRVFLGIEAYNEQTGEVDPIIPSMNPATGSRNVSIPTVADAEGGERQILEFKGQSPEVFRAQQDGYRLAMASIGSVPAFVVEVGSTPASGAALEIAYMPHVAHKGANERVYGPFLDRLFRLATRRYLYKLTGVAAPGAQLKTVFSNLSTTTAQSRAEQFALVSDGRMGIAEALVEFLGWDRDRAEAYEVKREAERQANADRRLALAEQGLLGAV